MDFDGFVLEVRKPEHGERHCHALRHPGGHLVVSLDSFAVLEEDSGFNGREIKAIIQTVMTHHAVLLAKWRDLNG